MPFGYDTIETEAVDGDRRDRQPFVVCKFGVFSLLIFDRVLLIVRLICAFAAVHEIKVPVFTEPNVLQYLILCAGNWFHGRRVFRTAL